MRAELNSSSLRFLLGKSKLFSSLTQDSSLAFYCGGHFLAGISWWLRESFPLFFSICRRCRVRFRLAVSVSPLRFSFGFGGLPIVPIPPGVKVPPLLRRQLFERPFLFGWSAFPFLALPSAGRLSSGGMPQAVLFLRREVCPGLSIPTPSSFMDFCLGGFSGSLAFRFSRHSFCHSRLCASRFSSASCSSGVRSPLLPCGNFPFSLPCASHTAPFQAPLTGLPFAACSSRWRRCSSTSAGVTICSGTSNTPIKFR